MGSDEKVRVISSSRQLNCDVIGMTKPTVCPDLLEKHMYIWLFYSKKELTRSSVCIVTVYFRMGNGSHEIKTSINSFSHLLIPANLDFHVSYK